MRHYGAPSPKRHVCYANCTWIAAFDQGRLRGWHKSMNQERRNTVESVDPTSGKRKWHGSRHLKSSQSEPKLLTLNLASGM